MIQLCSEIRSSQILAPNIGKNWASQVALVVENNPANAGDLRDMCSIPGLGRSPEGGHGKIMSKWFL